MSLAAIPDHIARLREALAGARYDEDGITEALGIADPHAIEGVDPSLIAARLDGGGPLVDLIRLFLLDVDIATEAADEAIRPLSAAELVDDGLLEEARGRVRARFRLLPHEGMVLASDWTGASRERLRRDHVLGHNPTGALLANVTVRRHVAATLDLGAGGGIQGLLAARHSDRVVAADVNPRAVEVARFNAALNDVELEVVEGDLFEPLADRRFDLIVCNPPFVISPDSRFLYRDSGLGGEGIVRRVIREAPDHLAEGGYCQLLANWAHVRGQDWRRRIEGAFEGTGCEAWVLVTDTVDPVSYAAGWIRQTNRAGREAMRSELERWLEHYDRERIEAISWSVVTMRRGSGSTWFEIEELAGRIDGPSGEHLRRCFEGRARLAGLDDEGLLAARPRISADVRLEHELAPQPEGWVAVGSRLASASGLPFAGEIEPAVANMMIRCDGRRTLRELLAVSAEETETPIAEMEPAGLGMARRLIARGYLELG